MFDPDTAARVHDGHLAMSGLAKANAELVDYDVIPPSPQRASAPELDAILRSRFPIRGTGDLGWIEILDYMGNDAAICEAARTSTRSASAFNPDVRSRKKNARLIDYMIRHHHGTPFEMATLKLRMSIAMDTWRQFIRHRMLSVNEYSTRYSPARSDKLRVEPGDWRGQGSRKQGSTLDWDGADDAGLQQELTDAQDAFLDSAEELYRNRLRAGVAREQARKDLPLSTMTTVVVEMDLRNWLHFLELRLDSAAQDEIRAYAERIAAIVALWCPLTWRSFHQHVLTATTFTQSDLVILGSAITAKDVHTLANTLSTRDYVNSEGEPHTRLIELLAKLEAIDSPAYTSAASALNDAIDFGKSQASFKFDTE